MSVLREGLNELVKMNMEMIVSHNTLSVDELDALLAYVVEIRQMAASRSSVPREGDPAALTDSFVRSLKLAGFDFSVISYLE